MSKYVEFKKFLSSLNPNGDNLILEAIQKGYNVIFEGLEEDAKYLNLIDSIPQPKIVRPRGHAAYSIKFWGAKGQVYWATQKFLEYLKSFPKNKIEKTKSGNFDNWHTESEELVTALTNNFDVVKSRYKRDIKLAMDKKPEQSGSEAPKAKQSNTMTMKAPKAGARGNFILMGSGKQMSGYPVKFEFSQDPNLRKLQNEFLKFHGLKFAESPFKAWIAEDEDLKSEVTEDFDVALNEFKKEKTKKKKNVEASASLGEDVKIDVPTPEGKKYYKYQLAGIKTAYERGKSLIADDPGLGKTQIAIGVAQLAKPDSVLIICNNSKMNDFKEEWEDWDTLGLTIGEAVPAESKRGILPSTNVVIIGWRNATASADTLKKKKWDMIIMDEPHEQIGNYKGATSQALIGYESKDASGRWQSHKGLESDRILLLTATPTQKGMENLFPILKAVDPDGLGKSYPYFKKVYMNEEYDGRYTKYTGAKNQDQLQRLMREGPMIQRDKAAALPDLPPKSREIIKIEPTGEVKNELSRGGALNNVLDDAKEMIGAVKSEFTKGARRRSTIGKAKIPYVIEEARTILSSGTGKLVIMLWHEEVIKAVADALEEYNPLIYIGGKTKRNDINKNLFQKDPKYRVIVVSMSTGKSGITLTAANTILFGELDWMATTMMQAEDRIHRIGQHGDTVYYKYLIFNNSLEGRMLEVTSEKADILDNAKNINKMTKAKDVRNLQAEEEEEEEVESSEESNEENHKDYMYDTKTGLRVPPLTNEEKQVIRDAAEHLYNDNSDGARALNGVGYNKPDTEWGKKFHNNNSHMSDAELLSAYNKIYPFYRLQLGNYNERLHAIADRLRSEGVRSTDMK